MRQESQESSTTPGGPGGAVGVPGMLSNSPPPPATVQQGAASGAAPQQAQTAQAPAQTVPPSGESRATRSYELGREVAVSNVGPGGIKRMSVAVALSAEAMKKSKPADIDKLKALVSAAVGADPARGDQVEVMVRSFADNKLEAPAFYETGWFATAMRYAASLIGVLLVLLLGVRPMLKALKRAPGEGQGGAASATSAVIGDAPGSGGAERPHEAIDRSLLNRQVGAAQKFVEDRPDRAVVAIRQMLNQPGA